MLIGYRRAGSPARPTCSRRGACAACHRVPRRGTESAAARRSTRAPLRHRAEPRVHATRHAEKKGKRFAALVLPGGIYLLGASASTRRRGGGRDDGKRAEHRHRIPRRRQEARSDNEETTRRQDNAGGHAVIGAPLQAAAVRPGGTRAGGFGAHGTHRARTAHARGPTGASGRCADRWKDAAIRSTGPPGPKPGRALRPSAWSDTWLPRRPAPRGHNPFVDGKREGRRCGCKCGTNVVCTLAFAVQYVFGKYFGKRLSGAVRAYALAHTHIRARTRCTAKALGVRRAREARRRRRRAAMPRHVTDVMRCDGA